MIRFAEILLEPEPTPFWQVLRQVGVTEAVTVLPRYVTEWREIDAEHPWEYTPLALHQQMIEQEGMRIAVVEDNPPMDRIRLGRPGREEEIEHFCSLVRAMGRLGIPVLCYNWMAVLSWQRTAMFLPARGGARVSGYDDRFMQAAPMTQVGEADRQDLRSNLRYFLERVLPVAEEAGVRLAMHPDDPPIPSVRGIGRIMCDLDAFQRLIELVPSPMNGITLCQGNFALMTDDVPAAIRHFGHQDRIFFVHFRDVRGEARDFVETFHDEGQTDMLECMRAYRDVGFDGVLRSDHVPALAGDRSDVPGYSTQGRLFAIGYTTALREAVYGKATPSQRKEVQRP